MELTCRVAPPEFHDVQPAAWGNLVHLLMLKGPGDNLVTQSVLCSHRAKGIRNVGSSPLWEMEGVYGLPTQAMEFQDLWVPHGEK